VTLLRNNFRQVVYTPCTASFTRYSTRTMNYLSNQIRCRPKSPYARLMFDTLLNKKYGNNFVVFCLGLPVSTGSILLV